MPGVSSSGRSPVPSAAATNRPICPALGNTRARTIFWGVDGGAARAAAAAATISVVRMARILTRKWVLPPSKWQRHRPDERDLRGLRKTRDADRHGALRHVQPQAAVHAVPPGQQAG